MSEFTPITIESQEQLDDMFKDRLKRNDEKWAKKFEGYISPDDFATKTSEMQKQLTDTTAAYDGLSKKVATHEKELAERDSKIKGYEVSALKHRIAHENGLSYDAIDFLKGEDEESIKSSAEKFKALVGKSHSAPAFSNEPDVSKEKNESIKKLAQSLTPKNN